jgi:hypothetical protein
MRKEIDMQEHYGSHLAVLKKVISAIPCSSSCLEFGPGSHSTKLLSDKFMFLTSIEMNSSEWFNKINKEKKLIDKLFYCPGPTAWQNLNLSDYYDLIFVDGHEDSRPDCVNWAFKHTDVIVVHDTEEPLYKWGKIEQPDGWSRIDVVSERPWTTVFYTDDAIEHAFTLDSDFTIVLNGRYFNKDINKIPGSIAWVTRLGVDAFRNYKNEFKVHQEMLEKGIKSFWFCNFPLTDEYAKAELSPIETYHNLDLSRWLP